MLCIGSQIPLAHLFRSEPQSRLCNKLNKLTLATFDEDGTFIYNNHSCYIDHFF